MSRRMRIGCSMSLLALFSMPVSAANQFAQCMFDVRYEVVELSEDAQRQSKAHDVNNRGQVTGEAEARVDDLTAFVWDCRNGLQDVDGASFSVGTRINDRGQVAGYSSQDYFSVQPFIWSARKGFRELTSEEGNVYHFNDWGDVVLGTTPPKLWNERHGVRTFREITGVDLLGPPAINNARSIAGISSTDQRRNIVVWNSSSGLRTIAPIPANVHVDIAGMNDRQDIIGRLGANVFVLGADGEMQIIQGLFADPLDINNWRQVVGTRGFTMESSFIWDPFNGTREFSSMVLQGTTEPRNFTTGAINDWGWIAGVIRSPDNRRLRSALFIPVPKGQPSRNLSQLKGNKLCRALDAARVNMLLTCLDAALVRD